MNDLNDAQAGSEARAEAARRGTSNANRNRFWAGLNRYLAAEAELERKTAKKEQGEAPRDRRDASRTSQ